ncbi:ArnT family glycosyltransferase [Arenibacter troitsensis]|uniref:4-amino-4-deoxy-L-arabinose transferase n=1 Tax=Arenibacter troitsensis TaxID=188872 RepID=A0A1X7L2U2_9FLAO|nr:glycosyltransferase family 39 protein [Arenibacter troitsensis]SMG48015.1 4-amino-4-deoxy-L-arabinose transferase [Arenibacter troitsensis]
MLSKGVTNKHYLLFLGVALALLLAGVGSYGFTETSEARYAEISKEMLSTQDFINPKLLGIYHFHKPPITYYITTLGYRIFGINEFGARFFLQIAIVLQMALVYGMVQLLYNDRKIAITSSLVYFAMPLVLISSRNLTTDAYLTTFILGALYCWQYYTTKGKIVGVYLFYLLVALALLTKGPVALLFILTYIIVYRIIFKRNLKISIHHVLGFGLCLILASSWYILVIINNPGLWDYFVTDQLISRITSHSFNRSKPFWFYIPLIIGLTLPWWWIILRNFKRKAGIFLNIEREDRLLLISFVLLFLIFSVFKTKMVLYILPMFWMLAILIAVQLYKVSVSIRNSLNLAYAILMACLFLGILGFWFWKPQFIQISNATLLIGIALVTVFVSLLFYVDKGMPEKPAILGASFGAALILLSTSIMAHNGATFNSTKEMVGFINNVTPSKNKTIVVYDYLLSSIPMYSGDTPITLKLRNNTTDREVQFQKNEDWKEKLWDINDEVMVSRLDSLSYSPNTYLIIDKKRGFKADLKYLEPHFKNRREFVKWMVLYNK